jgi:hypothetical protein
LPGVFRHVAIFTFAEGTTPGQVEAMSAGLARLPSLIAVLRDYRFGPDARLTDGNGDFAVVADFDDAAGYQAYATHPAHVDVATRLVRPILAHRSAVQFTT